MGFKKKAKTISELPEKDYDYEMVITDADTAVFRAAKYVQEDFITVRYKDTKKVKEFKNKTEFYGGWRKKDGGWLAGRNEVLISKGKSPLKLEDFNIEEHSRLSPDLEDHVDEGVKQFDFFVGKIKSLDLAPDYKMLIGGSNNFRYDIAETLPYKGERKEKPLLFEEIRDNILKKYKSKVRVIEGKEADDEMAVYGLENKKHFDETGKWKYLLAFIDKDIRMVLSPSVNPDKIEDGVVTPTELDCAKHFGKQLLCGDRSVDNIAGLPNLAEDLRVKFKVRKGNSLGDATAVSYLKSCDTTKEVFKRVVDAYRAYYGDDTFEFTNYKGETYQCDWLDRLQEVAILVYMNPLDDPLDFDIRSILDEHRVDYK